MSYPEIIEHPSSWEDRARRFSEYSELGIDLVLRLDRAIPPQKFAEREAMLRSMGCDPRLGHDESINGGFWRGNKDPGMRVASYNNTAENEQEIIEWFERALMGVKG